MKACALSVDFFACLRERVTSDSECLVALPSDKQMLSSAFFSIPNQAEAQQKMPESFYLDNPEARPSVEARPSAESFSRARSLPLPLQDDEDGDKARKQPNLRKVNTYIPR